MFLLLCWTEERGAGEYKYFNKKELTTDSGSDFSLNLRLTQIKDLDWGKYKTFLPVLY